MKTQRERVVDLLKLTNELGMSISELAKNLDVPIQDVIDDLRSISKSSKHKDYILMVAPPECNYCGFKFEKSLNPSKCPSCRRTWIIAARVVLSMKKGRKKKKVTNLSN